MKFISSKKTQESDLLLNKGGFKNKTEEECIENGL